MLKQELAILREHIEVTLPELSCKQQILRNTSGHWHGKRHIIFLKHPFIERYQMILWYQLATVARWIFAMQMVSKRCRRQRQGGFPWNHGQCHGHHGRKWNTTQAPGRTGHCSGNRGAPCSLAVELVPTSQSKRVKPYSILIYTQSRSQKIGEFVWNFQL